ncbi:PP2C family protein-serine/threonine phosphatase [Fundidesulfovibrio soli]|uniref:PP2C family protein-serine/threonine phosphatase n=1 Tax=Fundidesulfovibrio soli TaxID=2922716 RepID=UPI001FAEF982|nr:GAF domain-containing SpoIIE family protein phosphatase [Fundidesulfovibrio soli]
MAPPDTPACHADNLKRCFELCALITSSLDVDEVLERIMTTSRQALHAETCSLLLTDADTGDLVFTVAQGPVADKLPRGHVLKRGQGVAGWVQVNGVPALVPDAYADARFNPEVDRRTGYHTRSILAVPLAVKERVIGVAALINRIDGQPFDTDDQEVFQLIAAQAAIAIENARLHRHLLEKQRLEFDMAIAASVHNDLMPHEPPPTPGFDLAGASISCDSTGGDYYDYLPHPDPGSKGFSLAVGDVTGHGIGAALLMASARAFIKGRAERRAGGLAAMLADVNDLLCRDTGDSGRFMTLFWLAVEPAGAEVGGALSYAKAGHDPALLYNPADQSFEELNARGVPLGVAPGWRYEAASRAGMAPGEVLVLATDGIWECRSEKDEMYGKERLRQTVAQSGSLGARAILDAVLASVAEFRGKRPPNDDMTLVVLKALG